MRPCSAAALGSGGSRQRAAAALLCLASLRIAVCASFPGAFHTIRKDSNPRKAARSRTCEPIPRHRHFPRRLASLQTPRLVSHRDGVYIARGAAPGRPVSVAQRLCSAACVPSQAIRHRPRLRLSSAATGPHLSDGRQSPPPVAAAAACHRRLCSSPPPLRTPRALAGAPRSCGSSRRSWVFWRAPTALRSLRWATLRRVPEQRRGRAAPAVWLARRGLLRSAPALRCGMASPELPLNSNSSPRRCWRRCLGPSRWSSAARRTSSAASSSASTPWPSSPRVRGRAR